MACRLDHNSLGVVCTTHFQSAHLCIETHEAQILRQARELDKAYSDLTEANAVWEKKWEASEAEVERLKDAYVESQDRAHGAELQLGVAQSLLHDAFGRFSGMTLHDSGCPEDDTCTCGEVKRWNEAMKGFTVNRVCAHQSGTLNPRSGEFKCGDCGLTMIE